MDTPDPPGPPKLNNSEPIRSFASPLALARISAMPMVLPPGLAQSSGTLSVAHRQSPLGVAESPVALQRPQSSRCDVSEEGRAAVVASDGDADGGSERPFPSFPPPPDEPPPHPATSTAA